MRRIFPKILLRAIGIAIILPVVAASQWYVSYKNGLQELERGQWQEAARSFQKAIDQKQKPDLNAVTYALAYEEYLPYYHMGRALFFLGDYVSAIESFKRELSFGVIQKSSHHNTLRRLLEIAETLLAQSQQDKSTYSDQIDNWLALLRVSHQQGQGASVRTSEIDSLLAKTKLEDGARAQIAKWFGQLSRDAPSSPRLPNERPSQLVPAPNDSTAALKNAAIAAYLQGRYHDALNLFNRLAQVAPEEPRLGDWQQRLRFELDRLDQSAAGPLLRTDTVTVESSATPMISILEPRPEKNSFRSKGMRLAGMVNDDVGIAALEIVVNGEPLHFADGGAQLHPQRNENGTYPFEVEIPLRMNENHIAVTAYDLDKTQHRRTELRQIFRKPPLQKTATFWLVAGSALLVITGVIVGNRIIKYRITFVNRYNPYIAGAPIRNDEMFFGRQLLLDRILRTLPNNSLMVHGPRRIGKTSLQFQLQRLLKERRDPEYHFVPVFIDLQGIPEEFFFAHLIEEVRDQLGPPVMAAVPAPANRAAYGYREFANDLRAVIGILQSQQAEQKRASLGKKVRLVFLVDEVDELNRYSERTNQRLRAIFMKTFSETLVAVLTGSNIRKQWESESSPWYNFFEQIPMPELSRDEALALMQRPVKGFYKFEPEAAEMIWHMSKGRPFVIQKYCVRLVNLAIERRSRHITITDVEAISAEVLQDTTGQTRAIMTEAE